MAIEKLIRGSAIFAFLAGSLRIVSSFLSASLANTESMEILYTVIDICILFASLGFFLYKQEYSSTIGLLGFMILLVGCSILIGPNESKSGVNYYFIGVKVYSIGLLIFALDSWRNNKFSKWPPMLWIGSIGIGFLGLIVGYFDILFRASGFLFGVAFIIAGREIFVYKSQRLQ